MRQHPTNEDLHAFLTGSLPSAERRAVLLHLSQGCAECRRRLARFAARALGVGPAAAPPLPPSAYDAAVDRAIAAARSRERALAGERREVAPGLAVLLATASGAAPPSDRRPGGWALVEELLARSYDLRYRDPAEMVRLAELARLVVGQLPPERYGAGSVADLEARVHGELANAYRVADELDAADRTMEVAEERREEGTGDLLLKARLLELRAAVRRDQGRSAEAAGRLRRAQALYEELGERHLAGRTLVSRSLCARLDDPPGAALGLLSAAFDRIDPARDPKLLAVAEQNVCSVLIGARQFLAAHQRLARGDLHRALADEPLGLVRLEWLKGQIALGLGYREQAEATLREVQGAFLEAGKTLDAEGVALDLAAARLGGPRSVAM